MRVSVIVVGYKHKEKLIRCLESIPDDKDIETIMIDNSEINRGFSVGCNLGAKQASGELLFFLNPDAVVARDAIQKLRAIIDNNEHIGIAAPQLVDMQGDAYLSFTRQPTFVDIFFVYSFLNTWWPGNRMSRKHWYKGVSLDESRLVESASGAALMIRRDIFEQLGGFDERFFMYWEDLDLSRRVLEAGKQIVYEPEAKVMHERGGVTPEGEKQIARWFKRSRYRFFQKHFGVVKALLAEGFLRASEDWVSVLIIMLILSLYSFKLWLC